MKRMTKATGLVAATLLLATAATAQAPKSIFNGGSIVIIEGFAQPNDYDSTQLPDLFHEWCNNGDEVAECFPLIKLEVTDTRRGKHLGTLYTWGQDFGGIGNSLNFREFIYYDLNGGELYTISEEPGHPGGAFADPEIIIPKEGVQVLLGGAEGRVAGGTGKYAGAYGGYSTRLKVEIDGAGNFFYYDELYIRFREIRVEN